MSTRLPRTSAGGLRELARISFRPRLTRHARCPATSACHPLYATQISTRLLQRAPPASNACSYSSACLTAKFLAQRRAILASTRLPRTSAGGLRELAKMPPRSCSSLTLTQRRAILARARLPRTSAGGLRELAKIPPALGPRVTHAAPPRQPVSP